MSVSGETQLILAHLSEQDKALDEIATRVGTLEQDEAARVAVARWRSVQVRGIWAAVGCVGTIAGAAILSALGVHT